MIWIVVLLLVAVGPAFAQSQSGGAWLDRPLTNWNRAGSPVPKAPDPESEPATTPRCADMIRPPSSAEDRAVTRAGWSLVSAAQVFGDVRIVAGMTGVDGMCRPTGYQVFVFIGGKFAGTLSPVPMSARTDGAHVATPSVTAGSIVAQFARYRDADPLCCPWRTSTVTYQLDRGKERPLAVPASLVTGGPGS